MATTTASTRTDRDSRAQDRPSTTPEPARRESADLPLRTTTPRVDIYETEKAYVVLADMPGVGPDGLDVVAERGELIIDGRVAPVSAAPDYQEFEATNFHRAFALTAIVVHEPGSVTFRQFGCDEVHVQVIVVVIIEESRLYREAGIRKTVFASHFPEYRYTVIVFPGVDVEQVAPIFRVAMDGG